MEFRRYDKINCSLFDLLDGDLEPKQTMALGYLLAKSQAALKALLKLVNINVQYDKYVVDCEAQRKQANNNDRIDVLIRFYKNLTPLKAIIIEAKSVRANTSATIAAIQAQSYCSGFSQLDGFNNIELVVLTKESSILANKNIHSITWTQLVSTFHDLKCKNTDNYDLVNEFVNYIINIKGNMKYYEEEILAIPAGNTKKVVENTGIYECPENYNTHKQSLYISFKAAKGGEMTELYKLIDKYIIDINDCSAIQAIDNSLSGFANRINLYKQLVPNVSGVKQVYVLDMINPVKLPHTVRPAENNTAPAYYSLSDFLAGVNSNIGKVIVQKNIWVDENDLLHINTNGKKVFNVKFAYGTRVKSFSNNGTTQLHKTFSYIISVKGTNRNVSLRSIELEFKKSKWMYSYKF